MKPALQPTHILECVHTDIPEEVKQEARQIWIDRGYPNDCAYHRWDIWEDMYNYPAIAAYLIEHKISDCLIHYWW